MKMQWKSQVGRVLPVAVCALFVAGCQGYLVFTTATKAGLHISQQADQSPSALFGYKRAEVASIPANPKNASTTEDTYSVLATFCVRYDPLFSQSAEDSLQIRSVFATGMAAREAAKNPEMQSFFAAAALKQVLAPGKTEKKCF